MFCFKLTRRQRTRLIWVALLAQVLAPMEAMALSMGNLQVYSRLNQPLNAAAPLTIDAGESLADLHINGKLLVNSDNYAPTLHLTLEKRNKKQYTLHIGSDDAIQTTAITLKINLDLPDIQTTRTYTTFIDTAPEPATNTYGIPISKGPRATFATRNRTALYGPVTTNETLWSVAESINPYSDISQEQMVIALYRSNPTAFYQASINALKTGAILRIPSYNTIRQITSEQARLEVSSEFAHFREIHRAQQAPPPAETASTVTPVDPIKSLSEKNSEPSPLEIKSVEPTNPNNTPPTSADLAVTGVLPTITETSLPTEPRIQETPTETTVPTAIEPPEQKKLPPATPKVFNPSHSETNTDFDWILWLSGGLITALIILAAALPHYMAHRKRTAQARTLRAREQSPSEDIQYPQQRDEAPTYQQMETVTAAEVAQADPNSSIEKPPKPQLNSNVETPATDLEFGLSLLPLDNNQPLTHKPSMVADQPVAASTKTAGKSENFSAVISDLTDMDEIETKLDLALTYADMGDGDSALTLLDEIFATGNPQQQTEARKLLVRLNTQATYQNNHLP